MADGRRFTIEDVIKSEVEKALSGRGITKVAASDQPFSMKDIMTFLTEINKLAALKDKTMAAPAHDQRAVAETAKDSSRGINKEKEMLATAGIVAPAPQGLSAEAVFGSITEGLDGVVAMFGDIKLSEAKARLLENKETVMAMLRGKGLT